MPSLVIDIPGFLKIFPCIIPMMLGILPFGCRLFSRRFDAVYPGKKSSLVLSVKSFFLIVYVVFPDAKDREPAGGVHS